MQTGRSLIEKFNVLCRGPPTGAGGLSEQQQLTRNIMEKFFEQQGAKRIAEEPALPYLSEEDEMDVKSFEEDDIKILASWVDQVSSDRTEKAGDFARKRLLDSVSDSDVKSALSRRRRCFDETQSDQTNAMMLWLIQETKKEERKEEERKQEWILERERMERLEEERKQEWILERERIELERERMK